MSKTTRKLSRRLARELRSPKNRFFLVSTASAIAAERLTRSALKGSWRRIYGSEPPNNPERLDVSWRDALGWATATGIAIGTARILARRAAAAGWKRVTGRRPRF